MNGERLRNARLDARLTLRELSELSGVDPRTISDIEHGRNRAPAYEKVVRLALALQMNPQELWPVAGICGSSRGRPSPRDHQE